jgi:hypothetical protein
VHVEEEVALQEDARRISTCASLLTGWPSVSTVKVTSA